MEQDMEQRLQQLKRDYLELERIRLGERDCLLGIIHVFISILAANEATAEDARVIKSMVAAEEELPLDQIERATERLKDKILTKGHRGLLDAGYLDQIQDFRGRLLEACRTIKRIMIPLLEDFYPMTEDLSVKARSIDVQCSEEMAQGDLEEPINFYLRFVEALKEKISEDFSGISTTFLSLLDHVKELEKTLTTEFGGEDRIKEIEYFEMKVNAEVGSIVDSFNLHKTIAEIKSLVIQKIENIKKLVTRKKEEERQRSRSAQEKMKKLSQRILQAERDAREMGKKAERFQLAAMKDGLTGLYNRNAFDAKIQETLKAFNEIGEPFSIILFDVDRFKEINDTFGHVAGDKVLKKVAQCLKESFRKNDFIARYGGDEFVVAIERLTREMARERVLNFRKALKKRRFTSHARGDVTLTVSAGIALAMDGDTLESLIERADKAMYASKQKSNETLSSQL
jgi:diguanylate cyclase (GGDEF)-like protein